MTTKGSRIIIKVKAMKIEKKELIKKKDKQNNNQIKNNKL